MTPDTMLYSNYSGLASWLTAVSKEADPQGDPSSQEVAPATASASQSAAQDRILNKILDELIFNSRPEVHTLHIRTSNGCTLYMSRLNLGNKGTQIAYQAQSFCTNRDIRKAGQMLMLLVL